jgi:hypothetical protein
MKNTRITMPAALCALVVIGAGCSTAVGTTESISPRTHRAEVGRDVTLAPGDVARLPDGFAVRFERISDDSRCPEDVVCVTAGDAIAELGRVDEVGVVRVSVLGTYETPRQVDVGGYTVEVIDLTPAPNTARPFDPSDYRLTVVIMRPTG